MARDTNSNFKLDFHARLTLSKSSIEILFPKFHAIFCFLKMNFLATIIMKNSNSFSAIRNRLEISQDEFELRDDGIYNRLTVLD
jgi:hypothetical protein